MRARLLQRLTRGPHLRPSRPAPAINTIQSRWAYGYLATHSPPSTANTASTPAASTATDIKSPMQERPPRNHADGPEPAPAKDGSKYWEDMDSAIPRRPPKPTESELLGQVESVEVKTAPGVELSGHRKQLVGSVLDLFKGMASRQRLALWTDDAVFENNLNKAVGKAEVEAQWYGLANVMSDIRMLDHCVTRTHPDIEMEVENRYTLKGVGAEQVIRSTVRIEVDEDGRIRHVQDKWGGMLPESKFLEFLRRASSVATEKVVNVPTDETLGA